MNENILIAVSALIIARIIYLKEIKETTADYAQRAMLEEEENKAYEEKPKANEVTIDDLGFAMMQQWD